MESLLLLHGVISLQDGTSYHLINAISSGLTLFAKINKTFGTELNRQYKMTEVWLKIPSE